MNEDDSATEEEVRRARAEHGTDEIEIDEEATVSRTDDGVWVSAWVFLSHEEH